MRPTVCNLSTGALQTPVQLIFYDKLSELMKTNTDRRYLLSVELTIFESQVLTDPLSINFQDNII